MFRVATFFLVASAVLTTAHAESPSSPSFAREILPILSDKCFACHGPDDKSRKADLRLDVPEAARDALGTGRPDSAVLERIHATDPDDRMPPADAGKSLSEAQIAKLQAWIENGAPYEQHWAFVQPQRPTVPPVADTTWPRNPVDQFILARLEAESIAPSPEAHRVTLLRRVHLDLTGLPPSLAEIDAFLADTRPDAYEHVVDALLASPHFGERWGRYWLDAARYADSHGYSIDAPRSIWPYRDWVINAMNQDLPFDQFVIEQYAGDLLPNATQQQRVATGFHRNTMINQEGGVDQEEFRVESVIDRVNTTGTVLLGLTFGCARCHTHKYDPITHDEYFGVFAFLNNDEEPTLELLTEEQESQRTKLQRTIALVEEDLQAAFDGPAKDRQAAWESTLNDAARDKFPEAERTALAIAPELRDEAQIATVRTLFIRHDEELRELDRKKKRLERRLPKADTTLVLSARREPRASRLLTAGDYTRPAHLVTPTVPAVLHDLPEGAASRLDLARWLVDRENPLTARVTVNRFWMRLFGKGIVETDDDFGLQGTQPTHPELLDWLAVEFMDSGWRVKPLLRTLVTSATYRQASTTRPELRERDPRNLLLARQNRLRLDAEIIRDGALAAAGVLNPAVGGPGVFPPQPDGVMNLGQQSREWRPSKGADRFRRGMYTYFWRATPHPSLTVFDAPDAQTACTRRVRSTTPLQALTLLNDAAYFELAQSLAQRVTDTIPNGTREQIDFAFRTALGRAPEPAEADILAQMLQDDPSGWPAVARTLLNLDEFITRE
jgi:hypothetical protein